MESIRQSTIEYYNHHVSEFVNSTFNADMTSLYAEFEKYIDIGKSILDLGCGSGRDSKYFYEKGYHVTAIDASLAMCKEVIKHVPINVIQMRVEEIDFNENFDAIWACASLLHVAREDMQIVFNKIWDALKPNGVFYGSWKYGEKSHIKDGRYFADYTEEEMLNLIEHMGNIEVLRMWITEDVRTEKIDTRWLNILMKKIR